MALLAAPPLAFWLMRFKPIGQNNSLDPYFYTGYIHNFVDLIERYGVTYHSVRFGMILPAQLSTSLFGPIAGYFVLRYLLVLLAGVLFYVLLRQRYGRPGAWTTLVLLLTSPFLARTVLWDYTDASGVMFLFAAMCLFSIEHARRRLLDAGAGVCAALSIHSNVFAVAPLSIYFAAYTAVWLWHGRGISSIVRRLLIIVAGVGVVSALGAACYWIRVGHADIFSITMRTASAVAGGGMETWRTPGVEWITRQWWVLTPPVLVMLTTIVVLRRREDFHEAVVWVTLAGTTAFFAVSQFLLRANLLQLFYYFSYTLPIVFLSAASIVACLLRGSDRRTRTVSAVLLLIAALGPWLLRSFDIRLLVHNVFAVHVATVALGSILVASALRFRRPLLSVVACAAIGVMFYSSFARGTHAAMVVGRVRNERAELDVYRVALQFIRDIPPLSQRGGAIKFWYHNRPTGSLQSIQSTHLGAASKVQGDNPDRGLPHLGAPELARVLEPGVKWLGILAEQEADLMTGRAALFEHGIDARPISRRVLTSGSYTVHLELLEVSLAVPPGLTFGRPLIDVTDRTPFEVNVYGSKRGQVTTAGTRVIFTPADTLDHLASPFVTVLPGSGSWARVVVESPDFATRSCVLLVQDQDFNSLAILDCASARQHFKVPATTRAIRVVLADPKTVAFVLPRKIEVTLAEAR